MASGGRATGSRIPLVIPVLVLSVAAAVGWLVVVIDVAGTAAFSGGIVGLCFTAAALGLFLRQLAGARRAPEPAPAGDPVVSSAATSEAESSRFLDDLTGLPARFWFEQSFRSEIARCLRYHRPLSLVIISIDGFSELTQSHGRASGDYVLMTVAELLRKSVRQSDQLARLADEEFTIVVPETEESGAIHVGEKIRRAIELYPFDESLEVTASVGVTAVSGTDTVDSCLERARAAATTARELGGNGVATSAS